MNTNANTNTNTTKKKLIPVFALWSRKDKNGNEYFTGKTEDSSEKLVAFYNQKRHLKDSDINVFCRDGEKLVGYAKMWANVAKSGNKYLSGKIGEQRIIGFFNQNHKVSQPIISVFTEDHAEELPFKE